MVEARPSMRDRIRRAIVRWILFLGGLWVAAVLGMKWFENALVFQPSPASEWVEPGNPPPEDVWLTVAEGTRLHAWYFVPESGTPTGAILLAHGNGGNLSHRGLLARELARHLGRAVLVFDYPGYGKSDGSPSEAGCYAAGEAAYRYLTETRDFPPERIVLAGESLGGGVAVELATHREHQALVLIYTFTSLPAAAKYHKPWVPCQTLMSNRFDNLAKIPNCNRPVFIAHGTADRIIPFEQGETLFAAANHPKQFFRMEGRGHGLGAELEELLSKMKQFLGP